LEDDVVIVGFGPAGAAAALEASNAGASVTILEKASNPGGNGIISGGKVYAAGTSLQKQNKVEDSPEKMIQYLMNVGGQYVDPTLIRILAKTSPKIIDWLEDLGVKWDKLEASGVEGIPGYMPRTHVAEGGGRGLWDPLQRATEKMGVKIYCKAEVKEIIPNQLGRAIGVRVKLGGENVEFYAKKGIILTSGGFAYNKSLLREVFSYNDKVTPLCRSVCTGDGITMASAVNGKILKVPGVVGYPAVAGLKGPGAFLTVTRRNLASIFINEMGKRFVNEEIHYDSSFREILKQKEAFVIFDEKARKAGGRKISPGFSPLLESEIDRGLVKVADNIHDLSNILGVDHLNLERSIESWNRYAEIGKDSEFNRKTGLIPLEPPYYAVQLKGGIIDTKGGIMINRKAQVINHSGSIIPGLFSAGRVTGGTIGDLYPGSGYFILDALCFGKIAGREVLHGGVS
jgi:flavocytochrome c